MANAAMTKSAPRLIPAEWPAMLRFARSTSRHTYAQPPPTLTYVRSLARCVRGA